MIRRLGCLTWTHSQYAGWYVKLTWTPTHSVTVKHLFLDVRCFLKHFLLIAGVWYFLVPFGAKAKSLF